MVRGMGAGLFASDMLAEKKYKESRAAGPRRGPAIPCGWTRDEKRAVGGGEECWGQF